MRPAWGNGVTWTCHVCGDERNDDRIDVFKTRQVLEGGIVVQMNVRYCNDRYECAVGAAKVDFLGASEAEA